MLKTEERPDILSAQLTEKQLRRIKARQEVERLITTGATVSLVLVARRDYIKATAAEVRARRPIEPNMPMNADDTTIADMVPGSINFEVEMATAIPQTDINLFGMVR